MLCSRLPMPHLSCQESPVPTPCRPMLAHTFRPAIKHVQMPLTPRHSGLPSPDTSLSHTMLRHLNHPARERVPLPLMLQYSGWLPIIAGCIPARIAPVFSVLQLPCSSFNFFCSQAARTCWYASHVSTSIIARGLPISTVAISSRWRSSTLRPPSSPVTSSSSGNRLASNRMGLPRLPCEVGAIILLPV